MRGLDQSAGNSPGMQEMSALLASKMPVAEASEVLERLIGIKVAPATLDREARRQGTRALEERRKLDAKACAPSKPQPAKSYELVVLMDAWNIRERDQRGRSAGGRAVIAERGYVATREGIEDLREQLHAEATRRGLGQAQYQCRFKRPGQFWSR